MIGAILWLLGILGVVLMYGNTFWDSALRGYYIVNTLLMLVVALSLSYLIGNVYSKQQHFKRRSQYCFSFHVLSLWRVLSSL